MKFVYFWKPFLWLAIICYGLFIPANALPTSPLFNIPYFDKLVHFSLFFVLCVLFFKPFKKLNLKHYYLAPVSSILLGLFLEASQHLVSISRTSDFYDFLANATGIAVATFFYFLFISKRKWEILF